MFTLPLAIQIFFVTIFGICENGTVALDDAAIFSCPHYSPVKSYDVEFLRWNFISR